MTIYISIASYCDKLLPRTITRAIETAHRPDQLRFGVVDQSYPEKDGVNIRNLASGQITYVHIHPNDARGACWARSVGMSLYSGEDWFLQIDSHMDFDNGWDTYIIEKAHQLQIDKKLSVISSYPPGFEFNDSGEAIKNRYDDAVMYNTLVTTVENKFKNDYPGLFFVADVRVTKNNLMGYHVGGGFLFAPGSFVNKFPYDPQLYFMGEEQSMSLRIFTHGWNIYHIPALPLYHLYNTGKGDRILHWDEKHDSGRSTKWYKLEEVSRKRFQDLCFQRKDLGIYGLGTERSLEDFAEYCGVDYLRQEIREEFALKYQSLV